jgi:hypothetical protein
VSSARRHSIRLGEVARYLGAVSILATGAVHAQQYYGAFFSVVPTIGTLFLLSFVGAGVVGAVLLAPIRRLLRPMWADLILVMAALGAIGIALGSLVSLLISEYMPLFGFMESGYRLAIVLALVFDGSTILLLALFVVSVLRKRHRNQPRPQATPLRAFNGSDIEVTGAVTTPERKAS